MTVESENVVVIAVGANGNRESGLLVSRGGPIANDTREKTNQLSFCRLWQCLWREDVEPIF